MKKLRTFRLSDETVDRLDAIALALGVNRTQALEAIIEGADLDSVGADEPPVQRWLERD
jgi:predicted transcriptional regulator